MLEAALVSRWITEASDRWTDTEESLPRSLLCCGSCVQISELYTEREGEKEAVLRMVMSRLSSEILSYC